MSIPRICLKGCPSLPAGTVYIGREHAGRGRGPSFKRSPWANPFKVSQHGRERAVELYRRWLLGDAVAAAIVPAGNWHRPTLEEIRTLQGEVLACWCDLGEQCHGDVLGELAGS